MDEIVFRGANDQAMTSSLLVAKEFGKAHAKVMRDIENLNCSDEFRLANFGLIDERISNSILLNAFIYASLNRAAFFPV